MGSSYLPTTTPTIYGQQFVLCGIHFTVNNSNVFYTRLPTDPPNSATLTIISYENLDKLLSLHQEGHQFTSLLEFYHTLDPYIK